MSCSYPANYEIARNITFSVFEAIVEVCPTTYLRPDPGGSMMPWLLNLLWLFFHLPTCFLRAVKWESAQYLALALAVFNIGLTVQAYVSTKLRAGEVLVWMPLTLLLDVGAMLQMVVLIIEMYRDDDTRQRGLRVLYDALWKAFRDIHGAFEKNVLQKHCKDDCIAPQELPLKNGLPRERRSLHQDVNRTDEGDLQDQLRRMSANSQTLDTNDPTMTGGNGEPQARSSLLNPPAPQAQVSVGADTESTNGCKSMKRPDDPHNDALHYAIVALVSFILGLILVALQIIGLYVAIKGRPRQDLMVRWCSPAFRDFALAVTTGNCQNYEVFDSSSNGIGCISLSGDQQRSWLLGAIVALTVALTCQFADVVLMMCTNSKTKWRGVKAQRPWFTMIGGVIMLGILIVFGVFNADNLPKGMTETVWIYRKEESRTMGRVCKGILNPPGLRGVMIGYMDGLFGSWGGVYDGRS